MYKISIKGLDKVLKSLSPQTISIIKQTWLQKGVIIVQNNITKESPVNTGLLRNIAKSYITTINSTQAKIESKQKYASAVEMGSKPHMPPVGNPSDPMSLASWSRKKGLNPRAVAMGIKKRGTKANPFMQRATEKSEQPLKNLFISELRRYI